MSDPPKKIKIVYLIDTLEPAGAEKQLVTVATGLDRARFDPAVVCLTRRGALERELAAARVPVHLIGKRHKLALRAFLQLRAWLHAERPDVLHTWMFTCNLFGRLAAKGLPIKTLASEVDVDPNKSRVRLGVDRILARKTTALYANSREVGRFYQERCAECHGTRRYGGYAPPLMATTLERKKDESEDSDAKGSPTLGAW